MYYNFLLRLTDSNFTSTSKPALFAGTADFYERIAEDLALPLEGDVLNDILRDNAYKSDPIHPNARGYRILAEAVADLLHRAGAV